MINYPTNGAPMQTVTLTPTSALTLPGSMRIQEGWTGPIDAAWCTGVTGDHPRIVDWQESVISPKAAYDPKYVRLALRHWEVRARVAQWFDEGVSCDVCGGKGSLNFSSRRLAPNHTACPECKGTGNLRQPSPIWWALDGPGKMEPWLSAALLWASALRAVAGMSPILGTYSVAPVNGGTADDVFLCLPNGKPHSDGPLKALASATLAKGYALLDNDQTMHVAVPDGTSSPLEKP